MCPAAIGGGTGGTGMEDLTETNRQLFAGFLSTFGGEIADANKPFGFKDFQNVAQMGIADFQ